MKAIFSSKPVLLVLLLVAALLCVGLVNYLIIKYSGSPVPVPTTPREAETYGAGKPLTYVVLGDSTTVAQGGDYDRGYARSTARSLAGQGFGVIFYNLGVSGAVAADVAGKQATRAAALKPDVALVAVGANDVTHLTSVGSVRASLERTIAALRRTNPDVRIVLTGSPDMGTIPRFPQPARWLAGWQSRRLNTMVQKLAASEKVVFASIARDTGPLFAAHPEYYAADKFHPTSDGYDTWTPVLNEALRQALAIR